MISRATTQFWQAFSQLPENVRREAQDAYRLFEQNPAHPSLHFKKIHSKRTIWSVRVNLDYRAVGIRDADKIVWFWIGSHSAYEGLLKKK